MPPGPATPTEVVHVRFVAGHVGAFQVAVAEVAFDKVLVIDAPVQLPPALGFQLPGGTAGLLVFVHPETERLEVPPGLMVVGFADKDAGLQAGRGTSLTPKFAVVLGPKVFEVGLAVVAVYPAGTAIVTVYEPAKRPVNE